MNKQNNQQEKDFFTAIDLGQYDDVKAMAQKDASLLTAYHYNCFGGTPITICSNHTDTKMIDLLLDLGADIDQASDWWAGPWNPIQSALSCGNVDLAEYFAKKGASIGVHEAAGLNQLEQLKRLLKENPSLVNQRGGDGCFPLHFAATTEVVDVLIDYKADLDARDIDHHSTAAQYLAPHRPKVVKHLFDKGATADIFSVALVGDTQRFDSMLAADPSLLDKKINQEFFPPGPEHNVHNVLTYSVGQDSNLLHTAVIGKQLDMLEPIVKAGLSIDSRGGYDDSTSMHMVAWRDELAVAKKLVELGAEIDLRSGKIHNNTPAGWAIVGGSPNVFCYLIDQGAVIQDYFESDIKAGLAGEFQKYKQVPLSNFQVMLDRIS